MAKSSISLLFVFIIFFVLEKSQAKLAPALYVFGDSTVDAGNNNGIQTYAKYNYLPYGIDYPGGTTGRPTNGRTMADFIALSLGLKAPPPAFLLVNTSTYNACEGFNYASASAGILPESGFKGTLSLGEQVGLFKKTVEEYLPLHLEKSVDVSLHLSKSIFHFVMGVNDYALNFLKKKNSGQPVNEEAFAELLVAKYGEHLTDLYILGARKFVVFDIEAMGCLPSYVNQLKPANSKCVDELNSMVLKFNKKLHLKLTELGRTLPNSVFVIGNNYLHILTLVENPQKYGLKDASNACCVLTPYGTCDSSRVPCNDRDSRVFFDAAHPTEAAYKILANGCFNGVGVCLPINLQQLALL
ncbi:Lipase [Parasponia andersonii]|uniref:Lipase n=1 Tax=Parasponia andersonii TaxID=3476 RepID=A0A2P5DW36_PARAD|nr:Lipase [Parasponia andersonii]